MARSSGALHHRLADFGSGADQHVEDAGRQPGLFINFGEQDRRGRRELGGFEDHAIAGDDGRGALPHRDGPGKIPRRNQSYRAQRLANRVGEAVAGFRRQRLAVHAEPFARVVLEQRDALHHFAARLLDDLPFLARQRPRDLVDAAAGNVGGAPQHAPALRSRGFLPGGNAATAASIASRTSAAVASGYSAITSLVSAGLMFLEIFLEAG